MVQLRDGSIVCTSYGWAWLAEEAGAKLKGLFRHGNFAFLGGYLLRSTDGGHTWQGPITPPPTPGEIVLDPFGQPVYDSNQLPILQYGAPRTISGLRLQDGRASYGVGLETFALGFPIHFDWSWRTLLNKSWEDVIFASDGGSAAFRKPRFAVWIGYDF